MVRAGRWVVRFWPTCIGRAGGSPHGNALRIREWRFSMNASALEPVAGHAPQQCEIGKMAVTEDGGFFVAQIEDFPDERSVVEFPAGADLVDASQTWRRMPSSWRCCISGNIDGNWRVKRHAGCSVGGQPLARALAAAAALAESGRPSSFASSVIDQVPSVGRVEHVLGVLFGELGQFRLDRRSAFWSGGRSAPDWRKSARFPQRNVFSPGPDPPP
jgi:hypothetical protein